jgi:mannosylglycerate hydrolase MGH1-like protein
MEEAARQVLRQNWTGRSTVPAPGLYPHQWSWDTAFVAVGRRHLSPQRAQQELESLFAAQWADGRVPHIVFQQSVPLGQYFPDRAFWRSCTAGAAAGAPRNVETSGIVQPPVHALAAWLVHQAHEDVSRRRGFLERLYPQLARWHAYLYDHRDLGGNGLVTIVHPWESGMDNSPCWDEPLSRVPAAAPAGYHRADLDHSAPAERPADRDYARYIRLAAHYRDREYRDEDDGDHGPHPFAVEDPGCNALLAASETALADIAAAVGADPAPHRRRAEHIVRAMLDGLWSPEAGLFRCRDVRTGAHERQLAVQGLVPLVVPDLPRRVADALVGTATGAHFGLGGATRLVPSYDLTAHDFDPRGYWRGPAWFNVNWLLERGLRQHGHPETADRLRTQIVETAYATGFAEYVDPRTGRPHGTRKFSWTAALALDLHVASKAAAVRPQRHATPARGRA